MNTTGTESIIASQIGVIRLVAPGPLVANATPTIDPNLQATFPFKDFPAVETTAKAGEVVLVWNIFYNSFLVARPQCKDEKW